MQSAIGRLQKKGETYIGTKREVKTVRRSVPSQWHHSGDSTSNTQIERLRKEREREKETEKERERERERVRRQQKEGRNRWEPKER